MRIPILVALLGATAMIPATANAQDRYDHSDRHDGHWQQGNDHRDYSTGGNWHRGNDRADAPQQQFRGDRDRGGRYAGVRPNAGAWQHQNGVADHQGSYSPQGGRPGPHYDRGPAVATPYQRDHGSYGGRGHYNGGGDQHYGGGYDRHPGYRGGYHPGGEGYHAGYDHRGVYDRDWRRDNRYDWRGYRSSNRYNYRLPRYYSPRGWNYGYRRFGVGLRLNSVLFGQNYWIGDPYAYRLPPAYGPYRWVRYYNDALLVDVRSGVVVDAVYDIFW